MLRLFKFLKPNSKSEEPDKPKVISVQRKSVYCGLKNGIHQQLARELDRKDLVA